MGERIETADEQPSGELRVVKFDAATASPPDYALVYVEGVPTDVWVWSRTNWYATPENKKPPEGEVATAGDSFLWHVPRRGPYSKPWEES